MAGEAPAGVALSNDEVVQTAAVGDPVGTLFMLGGTEPATFALAANPDGLWQISENRLEVAASLADRGGTSDEPAVQVTDAMGREAQAELQITIVATPPTNDSGIGEDDGPIVVPDPEDPEVDQGGFVSTPVQQNTSNGLKVTGKNNGSATWFMSLPLPRANSEVIFTYQADWSAMSRQGREAAVGFAFKQGDLHHLSGLRGNGSDPARMLASRIYGDFRKANQFTLTDDGMPLDTTKDGPNVLKLTVSADGKTYAIHAGNSDLSLRLIQSGRIPQPLAGVDAVLEFGIGGYFTNQDKGVFNIVITMFDAAGIVGRLRMEDSAYFQLESGGRLKFEDIVD